MKKTVKILLLIAVALAFLLMAAGSGSESSSSSSASTKLSTGSKGDEAAEPEEITYTHYNVTELFDMLKQNAMKAKSTFKGQYVELEGYLGIMDSDGKYIGLEANPNNYDYFLESVQCYVKNQEQKEIIMELNKGDVIIVKGKITSVGEVLGYSLDIDSIEKK